MDFKSLLFKKQSLGRLIETTKIALLSFRHPDLELNWIESTLKPSWLHLQFYQF